MNKLINNVFLLLILCICTVCQSEGLKEEVKKKRILTYSTMITSHPRSMFLISKELKKNPNYDVYSIYPFDSPYVAKAKAVGIIPLLNYNLNQTYIDEIEER
jgi:hypothetical protein